MLGMWRVVARREGRRAAGGAAGRLGGAGARVGCAAVRAQADARVHARAPVQPRAPLGQGTSCLLPPTSYLLPLTIYLSPTIPRARARRALALSYLLPVTHHTRHTSPSRAEQHLSTCITEQARPTRSLLRAQRHHVPLAAVPCLQYRRALERELPAPPPQPPPDRLCPLAPAATEASLAGAGVSVQTVADKRKELSLCTPHCTSSLLLLRSSNLDTLVNLLLYLKRLLHFVSAAPDQLRDYCTHLFQFRLVRTKKFKYAYEFVTRVC